MNGDGREDRYRVFHAKLDVRNDGILQWQNVKIVLKND